MSLFLPPLPPRFDAALRDVNSRDVRMRRMAVARLGQPDAGREEEAVAALTTLAKDDDPVIRILAIEALGDVSHEAGVASVVAAFDDKESDVREAAVRVAGKLSSDRTRHAVERALRSENPEMRFQACESFAELLPERVDAALTPLLNDSDPKVAARAAEVLGVHGTANCADALVGKLQSKDLDVRARAALALAHFGDPHGVNVLRTLLRERDYAFAAATALGEIGAKNAVNDLLAVSQTFFAPLSVKAAIAGALVRLGDARGNELLRQILAAFRGEGRPYAVTLIGELQLKEFLPELTQLLSKPRGVPLDTLLRALQSLSSVHEPARKLFQDIERREDTLGDLARHLQSDEYAS